MKYEFSHNPEMRTAALLNNAKDHRDYVRYIVVEDGYLKSTDSKALIVAQTEMQDGAYEVIKNTKTMTHFLRVKDVDFDCPTLTDLINPESHPEIENMDCAKNYIDNEHGFLWDLVRNMPKGGPVNISKYIIPAVPLITSDSKFHANESLVHIHNPFLDYVVMRMYRETKKK